MDSFLIERTCGFDLRDTVVSLDNKPLSKLLNDKQFICQPYYVVDDLIICSQGRWFLNLHGCLRGLYVRLFAFFASSQ